MPDDLRAIFGELAARVPSKPKKTFDFTESDLPVPPAQLVTDQLFIEKVDYRYGGFYRVDSIWFHAHYDTYRHLALLILSAMFHDKPAPIQLNLAHPASDIKHLLIEYNYKEHDGWGWRGFYYPRPYLVRYVAASFKDYGWGWSPSDSC